MKVEDIKSFLIYTELIDRFEHRPRWGSNYTSTYTDINGNYQLNGLPSGTYKDKFDKSGYNTQYKTVSIISGQIVTVNVQMI